MLLPFTNKNVNHRQFWSSLRCIIFFSEVIAYIKAKGPHPLRAAFALIGPVTLSVIGLFPVEMERYPFVAGLCFLCTMIHFSEK